MQAAVFLYRFGLFDGEVHTLEETGAHFGGLSRERIRRHEAIALAELRKLGARALAKRYPHKASE